MKIVIEQTGGVRLSLPVPARLAARFIFRALREDLPRGNARAREFVKALKEAKKQWKGLAITEVTSSDGAKVTIIL